MADELRSISVSINGHNLPMKVKSDEQEESIRRAAKAINDRLNKYRSSFSSDKYADFDYLAMVTLEYVMRYLSLEKNTDDTGLLSQLRELSQDIDNYIKKS